MCVYTYINTLTQTHTYMYVYMCIHTYTYNDKLYNAVRSQKTIHMTYLLGAQNE